MAKAAGVQKCEADDGGCGAKSAGVSAGQARAATWLLTTIITLEHPWSTFTMSSTLSQPTEDVSERVVPAGLEMYNHLSELQNVILSWKPDDVVDDEGLQQRGTVIAKLEVAVSAIECPFYKVLGHMVCSFVCTRNSRGFSTHISRTLLYLSSRG